MPPTKGKGGGAVGSRSQSRLRAAQPEPSPPSPLFGERFRVLADKSGDDDDDDDEGSSTSSASSKKLKTTNASTAPSDSPSASAAVLIQQEDTAAAAASPGTAARLVSDDRANAEEAAAASYLPNPDDAAAAAAASDSDQQVSSPLRQPYMVKEPWHPDTFSIYRVENAKYQAKLDRQTKLLSLIPFGPATCLDDKSCLPVRESVTQMVFQTAKAVVGLTSYIDGKLLTRCSGFLIDWNKDNKCGTVLTCADLLCTKSPNVDDWVCSREYTHDAEVLIHLLDDTTKKGTLINYHKHYNIAIFEVDVNMFTEIPPVSAELVDYGQEIFLIGRDEDLNLSASHGRVQCVNPGYFEYYHYMHLDCEFSKLGAGGPAIDTKGRIVGMTSHASGASFIPHLFTLKCLRMWKDFSCVPRLHLGLKLSSIKLLSSFHREKLSRKLNIEDGLIVIEVSEGSAAEKNGIRNGDIIKSLNGQCIPTVVELEIMLVSTCEDCLDKGVALGSDMDLMVGLFQIRKQKHCTKMLTLTISDDIEVIAEGTYPVSAEHKKLG